jgi:hypothetical protein
VQLASATYHLDPDLLSIVLNVGTEFNVRPLSPQGAAQHLRELLERYNFDLVKALAAYKVGPGRVDQNPDSTGVPAETRVYVARIVREYNQKKIHQENRAAVAAGSQASQLPCLHERAMLRNGWSICHDHRLIMGTMTRLYLSADESTFTDVPTKEITGYMNLHPR